MKITEIKSEKGHLFKITLSGGKTAMLDKDYCLEKGIRQDTEIDAETLKQYIKESDYRRALSRAVWYIERGSLSAKRLSEKLHSASFSKKTVKKVVARMTELGLIDDRAFAERLAEDYLSKCISVRDAEYKMVNKGIDRNIARAALDMFEVDATLQIKAIIQKNYRQKLTTDGGVQKVFAALLRKGFNYSDVKSVLAEYNEELKYNGE